MKIIYGKYKGMKIKIINKNILKPTMSKIKKTLFSWLKPNIKNKICLDCFAGSGILGIEAISNGAKYVISLEKNFKIFINMKNNFLKLKEKKYKLININSLTWLKKKNKIKFDIIFIDPPYNNKNLINKTIYNIEKNKLCKKKSLIYIETNKNNKIKISKKWTIIKKKNTQSNKYFLYKKIK